jgi:type IV pilus assembly protein PilM
MGLANAITYSPIGLDIGTRSIKMIQLSIKNGVPVLQAIASRDIPPAEKKDRRILLVQAIKEAFHDSPFRGKETVVFLTSLDLDIRPVSVSASTPQEILHHIQKEADSLLPYSLKEAVVDYLEVGESYSGSEKKHKILLISTKRNRVEQILEVIEEADLRCIAMDAQPFALARAVKAHDSGEEQAPLGVLDIGYETSTICVLFQGKAILSRYLDFGAHCLTRAIMDELEVDEPTAERYKVQYGIAPGRIAGKGLGEEEASPRERFPLLLLNILEDSFKRLIEGIEETSNYCSMELRGMRLHRMILTGGGGSLKNLDNYLQAILGIPVETWRIGHCFDGVDEKSLNSLGPVGPAYVGALGLALRGKGVQGRDVNLFPPEFIQLRQETVRAPKRFLALLCLALLSTGFYAYLEARIYHGKARIKEMHEIGDSIAMTKAQLKTVSEQRARFKARQELMTSVSGHQRWSYLLFQIASGVNDHVWLDRLNIEKVERKQDQREVMRITLQGYALSNLDLAELLARLSDSRAFSQIDLRMIRRVPFLKTEVMKFEIACERI